MAVPVGPAAVQRVERGPAEQLVDRGGDPGGLGVLVRRLVEGDVAGHRDVRRRWPQLAAARPGTSVAGAMACIAAVTMAGLER